MEVEIPLQAKACKSFLSTRIKSIDKIKNILTIYSKKEKEELTNKLNSLENVWEIKVQRKIKNKNYAQIPVYTTELLIKTNKTNQDIIDRSVGLINQIRREGKERAKEVKSKENRFYRETPSMNLMECKFALNEENFKKRVVEVFDVLKICLKVKSDSEIKKIRNEESLRKEKEIQEVRDNLDIINIKIDELEYNKKIGAWNSYHEDQCFSLMNEKNKLEKKLNNF